MKQELERKPFDWDEIYYEFQSAGISDSRYFSDNFDDQPVRVLLAQYRNLVRRDQKIANNYSVSIARCGLLFSSSEKLTEADFLPFPELLKLEDKEVINVITPDTAKEFMDGVNSGFIPSKVIGAASKYMDNIISLVND